MHIKAKCLIIKANKLYERIEHIQKELIRSENKLKVLISDLMKSLREPEDTSPN